MLAKVYEDRVAGPQYDQGSTLKALNFYEDYLILFATAPPKSIHESKNDFENGLRSQKSGFSNAEKGRSE